MWKMRKAFTGGRKVLSGLWFLESGLTLTRFFDIKELIRDTICNSGVGTGNEAFLIVRIRVNTFPNLTSMTKVYYKSRNDSVSCLRRYDRVSRNPTIMTARKQTRNSTMRKVGGGPGVQASMAAISRKVAPSTA